ncbi:Transcriptional regulator, contains XRE-family HTH domain [Lishizhenia tianjinensis]|uniref:Transcriptional regulator, contains XRE-family HTH domain n=1 Tax=Lishizhenia tianjinensis TaxID=477690 RepID=A0A1I6YJL3_9FLAO|nr:helix-turn-helix transcriptional regulator [Lishizhenia tianjinensis]SFT50685.1 Transcriptional regulator, contains XRE-family HTH domain [Lishizhenia tianjinensis]
MISKIGKNIKKIRKVKNLNQQAMADLLGLSRPSIGAYEEMRAEPKIESLIKLANHFKLDLGRLINEDLTVNEIHGFKQAEELVLDNKPIKSPAKPKTFPYLILKNNKLSLQKVELTWPLATNKKVLGVQETAQLCSIYKEVNAGNFNPKESCLVQKGKEFHYNVKLVEKENELYFKEELVDGNKVIAFQILETQHNVDERLKRLESILSKLSL